MRTATNIVTIVAATFLTAGCQSPLVGTWIESPEAPGQTTVPPGADETHFLVFRNDGTTMEYTIRGGRFSFSIPGKYRVNRDILIIEDEPMGCIQSEIAQRFTIEDKTLVLDDGTTRTQYQRLPQVTCLGLVGDSRRFEQRD